MRTVALPYVTVAMVSVSKALVNVDAGDINVPPISEAASTTKIVDIRTAKISSVNRVRYLTKLDADVMEDRNKIADVHRPVQVYKGRNGRFVLLDNWTNAATNANTGPVLPIIVNG